MALSQKTFESNAVTCFKDLDIIFMCQYASLPATVSEHARVHGDSNRAWIWGRTLESGGQNRGVTWKINKQGKHISLLMKNCSMKTHLWWRPTLT